MSQSSPANTIYPVFVGTNRPLDDGNAQRVGRADGLAFQRYDVSIPEERQSGRIQWPRGTADPSQDFVTTAAELYSGEDRFLAELRQAVRRQPPGEREIVVFVHGYNTTLAEGIYRLAQMDHDLELRAVPVYFSWPTAEDAFGYVHDRDSALFSRNDLEEFLRIIRRAGAERVTLLAHSMGSFLTAEVMRQVELRSPGSVPELADALVMLSPDIDEDLAITQLNDISVLPAPFVVFTSNEDRALQLATRIAGDNPRLGRGADVTRFADIEITFLDVTAFNDPRAGDFGHLTLGSSEALIQMIPQLREMSAALDGNLGANPRLVPGSVFNIRRATEIILAPSP